MQPLQAIVLALVQGVTEFLPISSSAHLILLPRVLGWEDQGLVYDVAAHTGTLGAVVVYFRQDLGSFVRGLLQPLRRRLGGLPYAPSLEERLVWRVALATVPVAACALFFQDLIATRARDPVLIALSSIVFGIFLGLADRWGRGHRGLESLDFRDALVVGLLQALALIPGTSRSGVTMTGGLLLNLDREAAVRFSFLLSLPVLLLATLRDLYVLVEGEIPQAEWLPLGLVLVLSGLSGYLMMEWLLTWVRRQSLLVFVAYRLLLGLVILALWLLP